MGENIHKDHFEAQDYRLFQQKLEQEMAFVRELFAERRFDDTTRKLGYELELCLLDGSGAPAPCNQQVLEKADNPLLTQELARFNLEINGQAFAIHSGVMADIQNNLGKLYHQVEQAAASVHTQVGLFGVLPSLRLQHLQKEYFMSDTLRYRQLSRRVMEMRGRPVKLEIQGVDNLQLEKQDVMLEALGTSLQVHYQVPYSETVDSYHAALWASMAMLAVSANSPLVLQKSGWQESRITIFKQAVDSRSRREMRDKIVPRVHLSKGYIHSWLELFEDNAYYSPILPEVTDSGIDRLHHFNLHNGTIWRWVRPILGVDEGGYHLRLELRVVPAGPTLLDTVANLVFYIGLTEGLKSNAECLTRVPYAVLERDFYTVARQGLPAHVNWCNGRVDSMQNLLLTELIGVAYEGLERLAIENPQQWLNIIEQRVQTGRTAAQWITDYWQKTADDKALVLAYLSHARQNIPVHLWPKP